LSNRLNYIDTTKGEPATLSTARRRIMSIYNQSYANNIALTNDHVAAHKTAMGVAMDAIGDDPQEGLFRVPKALEALQGKTQDFVDPSLNYQSIEPEANVLGQTFKALEQYPDERIYRNILIDPDAMREAADSSRGRGVFQRIPQIEAVANSLNVPYHVAHNNFAEAQLLPPLDQKTYATADDTTTHLHSAGYGKFLTATADIDKRMYADIADIHNGGSGIYYKQTQTNTNLPVWRRQENMSAFNLDPEDYRHTAYERSTGDMMMNYMRNDLGLSENHALGIYLNFYRESRLRTDAENNKEANGLISGGLGQWNGTRYDTMRQVLGNNWTDHKAQIKYALEEKGEPGQQYLNTSFATPLQAAQWWLREWERSAHQPRDQAAHKLILQMYNLR
jgi:putative ubiquitin-RnfH superfamily antitoxin RatB of RatAB toxin-antitoxin module